MISLDELQQEMEKENKIKQKSSWKSLFKKTGEENPMKEGDWMNVYLYQILSSLTGFTKEEGEQCSCVIYWVRMRIQSIQWKKSFFLRLTVLVINFSCLFCIQQYSHTPSVIVEQWGINMLNTCGTELFEDDDDFCFRLN